MFTKIFIIAGNHTVCSFNHLSTITRHRITNLPSIKNNLLFYFNFSFKPAEILAKITFCAVFKYSVDVFEMQFSRRTAKTSPVQFCAHPFIPLKVQLQLKFFLLFNLVTQLLEKCWVIRIRIK